MDSGKIFYKCRMCGEEFAPTHSPHILMSLVAATTGAKSNDDYFVSLLAVHNHADETLGIGDLLGARPYKDSSQTETV